MNHKTLRIYVILFFCLAGFSTPALAGALIRASGELNAMERDGSLLIDGKGYLISGSAQVQDDQGKSISISKLKLPTRISFEFRYTPNGPVITRIKQGSAIPE